MYRIISILLLIAFSASSSGIDSIHLGKHLSKKEYGDLNVLYERRYYKVLTNKNSLNYFLHKGKSRGFQYEMLRMFNKELNKKFNLLKGRIRIQFEVIPVSKRDLIPMLLDGRGDIIASGITLKFADDPKVSLSKPYKKVHQVIVKRKDIDFNSIGESEIITPGITDFDDFVDLIPINLSGSQTTNEHLIPFKFEGEDNESEEFIMELISLGKYKAAYIRSDYAELGIEAFENLEVIDTDAEEIGVSWAVREEDEKLLQAINEFIPSIKQGTLLGNILSNKYFDEINMIKSEGIDLGRHEISKYDQLIKKYSDLYGLDWRLMAALCYQESRFKQDIKNEWGAIGLFQIKQSTADEPYINISEIEGPENYENNIHAGIKYLKWIKTTYFDDYEGMSEKNKVRMAIASYNAGPNRIRRAINKTKNADLNHLKWFRNVEKTLIKMRKTEPVHYVSDINKRYVSYQLLGIEPD